MDTSFLKPQNLDKEIEFMRAYFGMGRKEQVALKEKMAQRVREFRVGDVWVVSVVRWGLVWYEWRRREVRAELGLW